MTQDIADDMQDILRQAQKHDGEAWEMVLGELQLQYGEACLWVLVDEPSQAATALGVLSHIVAPYMAKWAGVKFTVSLNAIEGGQKLFIDYLEGAEIFDHNRLAAIGTNVDRDPLAPTDLFLTERRRRLEKA